MKAVFQACHCIYLQLESHSTLLPLSGPETTNVAAVRSVCRGSSQPELAASFPEV